ncbi:hypothetical protein [Paenarthrobacter nitroguajacolicus]|uniref:hypothetical protein n=1 Tax=Paenarthrobacter nitroguajacolicus TaxID=211146 RepID=UPI00248B6E18|nr:hypothetical protein [Paenarthrobacter nitroguajacolicus]MDI2035740.1 hypothetical protein [Paenarthrobacter nitroguajacolicus]
MVIDRAALEAALAGDCPPVERIRYLALLRRDSQALDEGFKLLPDSPDRRELLLILAQVYQRQYRWHDAAVLHEKALRTVRTPEEEAYVRHHIGRRLFDEARFRAAADEFQWAADLYRVADQPEPAEENRQAMRRALHVHSAERNGGRPASELS